MKRNHEVRIKLSKEEKEVVRKKAELLGLSDSAFFRLLALKSTIGVTNEE